MLKKLQHRLINEYLPLIFTKLRKTSYLPKRAVFTIDILFVAVSFFLSCYIRYFFLHDHTAFNYFYIDLLLYVVITGVLFIIFNTSAEFIRFTSFHNILRLFLSLFFSTAIMFLLFKIFSELFHYTVYTKVSFIVTFLMSSCAILSFRMAIQLLYEYATSLTGEKKKIPLLIYGIDAVHIGMAKVIQTNENLPYSLMGLISPKPLSYRPRIADYKVYSLEDVFDKLIPLKGIRTVLIRTEELELEERKALLRKFSEHKVELLSAPPPESMNGIRKIRNVNIEDLLGRNPIKINMDSIGKHLKGKTILITGAAGSIGSEIVRQLCQFKVDTLLLCDIAESPLHQLSLDMKDNAGQIRFIPLIANVRNKKRMEDIFEKYKPHYIYHAAAYKHVPLMELYPVEAALTNVMGTKVIADLAVAHHAECFVMVSTDKAVKPGNVMGASKRIAEIYINSLSNYLKKTKIQGSKTRFITTRFGNVLGSNGSVVPLFMKQIAEGGPVTLTHPDINRYFMTIPEACSLVLEAGNFGKGGELFIFDMGKPVKIMDMAEEMIRLSGLVPYKDIQIKITGLRPGEKLNEELFYDKEKVKPTDNSKITISRVREYDYDQVTELLSKLHDAISAMSENEVVKIMKEIVPEYISENSEFEALDKK